MNVCTSSALGTLLIGSLSVILERVPPLCHAFSCHSIEKCGKFAHDEQLSHDIDPYLGFLGGPSVAENDHHVLFFLYKFNRPALKVVCALHQISHFCKFNHFYRLPLTIVLPAHLTTYFNNNHNPTTTTTVATSALATPTTTRATTAATNDGKP